MALERYFNDSLTESLSESLFHFLKISWSCWVRKSPRKPSTLNPKPRTLNPKPKPKTLNPKPRTLNPKP